MGVKSDVSGLAAWTTNSKRSVSESHSAAVGRAARFSTPPPQSDYLRAEPRHEDRRLSSRSENLDADAIDSALRREIGRQQREGTPGASPHRKRQRINGDRYAEELFPCVGSDVDPSLPDSFPRAPAGIIRLAFNFCTPLARRRRPQSRRKGHLTGSCTFRGVSGLQCWSST